MCAPPPELELKVKVKADVTEITIEYGIYFLRLWI